MVHENVTITYVALDVILPVRMAVIIAGTNRATPYFEGDDAPDTLHVAASVDGLCIGCATLLRSSWAENPAWQLRGMAVATAHQRCGIGGKLLRFLETTLPDKAPASGIWCNAREKAVPFYVKAGYTVMSERFHIENVGPHFRLYKAFAANNNQP